jgi:transketolase
MNKKTTTGGSQSTLERLALVENLYNKKNIVCTPARNGYGDGLVELGAKDKNVVVLCADLSESTRSHLFRDAYPDRYIQAGIAEQNMVGAAAGLALSGKTVFASSYAVFNPGRSWDQVRVSVCYNNANVKIVGAHAGISVGPDGATHQALEDIATMRVLPNMIVVAPCDYEEARKATIAIGKHQGPAYIRFGRSATPEITSKNTPFKVGKAYVYREGGDVTVVACGALLYDALQVADKLEKKGISVEVINSAWIKPFDTKTVVASAQKTGRVVTVEEHQKAGGLGSVVAETLAQKYPVPIEFVGMEDSFGESGTPDELYKKYKMTQADITRAIKKVLKR